MDLPAGVPRPPKPPPKSFNRSELVRALYEHFGARSVEAERLVTCLLDEIAGALERGPQMELRGLGALTVKPKRERQGRNPRTGEALTIEARRVVRFRVSEPLLARLNRRTHQRPERPKVDPRQLALPRDDQHEERADSEPVMAPSLTTGRRKAARKKKID